MTATASAIRVIRPARRKARAVAAGEAGEAAKGEQHRRGRRDRNNEFRKPTEAGRRKPPPRRPKARRWRGQQQNRVAITSGSARRSQRQRPPRQRFEGKDREPRQQQERPTPTGKFGGGRNKGDRDKGAIAAAATRAAVTRRPRQRAVAPAMGHQRRAARTRPSGRSEFAVRKTGGAQGTARRPQGLTISSTRGCARLERQRLDKWLWHARVVKARTSAAALVEAGHVRINGVREKSPGHAVKAGDVLTVALDQHRARAQSRRLCRAARRCHRRARAVRGFAGAGFKGRRFAKPAGLTICNGTWRP